MDKKNFCAVQQKISCAFSTAIVHEQSGKRSNQSYKVVATDVVNPSFEPFLANGKAVPSEKVDGTCVHVREYRGRPWLWARLDRKPNKVADRKFKKFLNEHRAWECNGGSGDEPNFTWSPKDLKDVPAEWVPASGVKVLNGMPVPDENGHIPGWVPVLPDDRQYLWHSSSIDLEHGLALVLRPSKKDDEDMEIVSLPLSNLLSQTLELIGTNVNANPYNLGSKTNPVHLLVEHGIIPVKDLPEKIDYLSMKDWFNGSNEGQMEGIVWHCEDGRMFKLHRHHLNIRWPVSETRLSMCSVRINIDSYDYDVKSQFHWIKGLNGKLFEKIKDLSQDFQET